MGKIYFISEAMHTPDTSDDDILDGVNVKYETCFKIGFSSNLKKRLISYISDTPRYRIHFVIDNATEEDEKRLHQYFSKYSREDLNGREWFIENKEMVKFFREHTTIEEIRSSIPELKISDKMVEKTKTLITPVINIMIENGIGHNKEEFKGKTESSIIVSLLNKYVTETQYYKDIGEFLDFLKSNGDINKKDYELVLYKLKESDRVKEELDKFNKGFTQYTERMKYVCELGKSLEKDKFNLFLNSIPISYKNYYTILGPDRCNSVGYKKGEMEKIYETMVMNQGIDVKSEITKHFKVGERYTSQYIKEQLRKIYDACGYKKTPRAVDLKMYFEVKAALIPNPETKKRDPGFDLISKIQEIDID